MTPAKKDGDSERSQAAGPAAKGAKNSRGRKKVPEPASLGLAKKACAILEDKSGFDTAILDVRNISSITDFFVLVSANNQPHLKAMFNEVLHAMKTEGTACYRKVANPDSGWMVLDYVDVVIHILLEETRKYYAIEDLWTQAQQAK